MQDDKRTRLTAADTLQRSGLPPKPRYAAACNGCGLCCAVELCDLGKRLYGDEHPAPCPGIRVVEGRVRCAYVMAEAKAGLTPKIAMALGIGIGCGMQDEDTTDAEVEAFSKASACTKTVADQ